jgi:hypothetical protein
MANCKIHPKTKLIRFCPKCRGATVSDKKAESSRRNGLLGGRPKLPLHKRSCAFKAGVAFGMDPTCRGCVARAKR